ncbi:glycosyltransferase [Luteimonas sp. XNQY3]|nr:glycosyltransferase [Luteimonas sp. XNQY3]MCD9005777.1 glycosyltransferase [Luteimonas sp. XNQY3]
MEQVCNGVEEIRNSALFDAHWYVQTFPDVPRTGLDPAYHYLRFGRTLERSPSLRFDAVKYVEQHADVAATDANPLLHYIRHGRTEGRSIYATDLATSDLPPDLPALLAAPYVFDADQLGPFSDRLLQGITVPSISVVMPTWNRRGVIGRALRSAFDQRLPAHEVIVVDDGSVDGTADYLRECFAGEVANGRLVILEGERGGVSAARNRALAVARSQYIAYLDSDNTWHRDHLLLTVGVLAASAAPCSAYSAVRINRAGDDARTILSKRFNRDTLLRGNFIDLNAFVHHRSLYERHGGFDSSLRRLVDWDLVIRYTDGLPSVRVPAVTVEYYLDEAGLGNITFTERIEAARDAIFVKHARELVDRRILVPAQIDRMRARVSLAKVAPGVASQDKSPAVRPDTAVEARFCVMLGSGAAAASLPDLGELDAPVVVMTPDGATVRVLSSSDPVIAADARLPVPPAGVYWCPDLRQPLPGIDQLRAMFLAIATSKVEMAMLSYALEGTEDIEVACLQNQVMVGTRLLHRWRDTGRDMRLDGHVAKVLRMLPAPVDCTHRVSLRSLLGEGIEIDPRHLLVREAGAGAGLPARRRPLPARRASLSRPVVLVLPMKVAVGGVERNTIEIMRALKDEYAFVYVTMEKVFAQQGSLAAQVGEAASRLIDMAECSWHEAYLELLAMLRDVYAPDVVWICNGSMWLCANASKVREVFHDVPIVDQQVYDVEEGWIRRYREAGIQSFDRFVAINSRIRKRFVDEFGMDANRIDLIYSVIDSERFRREKASLPSREALRRAFDLPLDRKVFAFMGRLVEQKRPLDFLEIARLRARSDELYVLVGNGVLSAEVETWISEHTEVAVRWIPYIEHTAGFWAAIDGLVVTSAYEGLPIAMLEALAMGVPAISTDVGDIALVLEQHGAGVVVDEIGNPAAFAACMDEWIGTLAARQAHLVEESERILDRFSARQTAILYSESWSRAIRERRAGRIEGNG